MERYATTFRTVIATAIVLAGNVAAFAQRDRHLLMNEQGCIDVRGEYCPVAIPGATIPPTLSTSSHLEEWQLSLDEAIRIALQNTDVVRLLSGFGAASSGTTIYSPAISNAGIDQARATFDPNISITNNFLRSELPSAQFDPLDPNRAIITGSRSDLYDFSMDLNKQFLNGANGGVRVGTNRSRFQSGLFPLNPQSTSDVDISLSQPLLRGRGVEANSVPIVLAFIDTERSYFRLKSSLQDMVAGLIQGYWDLVQARTELWVIEQQIRQADYANTLNQARYDVQQADIGQLAQSQASLANFKANLLASKVAVLNRVASLRAVLGLPPNGEQTIVPTTPPIVGDFDFDWDNLTQLAADNRPDLIELKLILDADQQRIVLSRNQAQPQLDAVALYRWNGLEGEMPIGGQIEADPGEHTDWALSVNFSVPFTLRAERATLRQNELLLASDRVNLRQGLLAASHDIAFTLRTIDQLQQQYVAFRDARAAAEESLALQIEQFRAGRTLFLDYLLAVNTWASTVTSEARSVTQLNSSLATLELQTGTILETHGIRLFEERDCALGPLGCFGAGRMYPAAIRPSENTPRYDASERPSEESFNLEGVEADPEPPTRLPPPEPEPGSP